MYTIEQFSIMTKIPLKSLRLYNDLDLLKPVIITNQNRYYYDNKSLLKAQLILICNKCCMSLNNIKTMMISLPTDTDLENILLSRLNLIEDEKKIVIMKDILEELKFKDIDRIRMTESKEHSILSIREPGNKYSVSYKLSKLLETAADMKLKIIGPYTVIWHGISSNYKDLKDLEVYIPVEKSDYIKSWQFKVKETMEYCVIDHRGSTLTLSSAYRKLYSCIKGNGLKIAGPFEETYITDKKIQLAVPVTL